MIDLSYPVEPAAIHRGAQYSKSTEMLPVCDEFGIVTSQAPRKFCHDNRLLHPVVRLNIIERSGNLVLQRRSADRENWPGRWDSTAAGHIIYGEDVTEALRRETVEETGLTDFNPICLISYRYDCDTESELVNSFAAVGSFEYNPNRDEVSEIRVWTPQEIAESLGKDIFTPAFEYEYALIADKLLALL